MNILVGGVILFSISKDLMLLEPCYCIYQISMV